jgi:type I restriction enzyme R subunit
MSELVSGPAQSPNFGFLAAHDARLAQLGALAERYFTEDPSTSLVKLRQFAEIMAKLLAARTASYLRPDEQLNDLLKRLRADNILPPDVAELFHQIKRVGNQAAHEVTGSHREALASLRIARELGLWFHRTFSGNVKFTLGPFVPPRPPVDLSAELAKQIDDLKALVSRSETEAERLRAEAAAHAEAALTASERAKREREDRATWEQIATETEAQVHRLSLELASVQARAKAAPSDVRETVSRGVEAGRSINLDEAETREIIDQQLRDAGWEVDSINLRFSKGSRPIKHRNRAIAEWPTASGPADYALFVGLDFVGVIEAKRSNKNVMEVLPQAERYSKGARMDGASQAPGGPWGDYKVPFVYSANGRQYLKQIETLSGIWRRDVRRPKNAAAATMGWPKPESLLDQLNVDKDAAQTALKETGFDFGFPLRPYQKQAIETIEAELANERRAMLVAMATGTGKTKLAIALLYRLLNAKRFRRICFVVDRSALGEQTEGEFTTTKVVNGKAFAEIFGIKGLSDVLPDPETRVHICTIQGLVKRVLYADEPSDMPTVDQYDLIIVDECHRGYLLDREMSDSELSFRSQDDYISKYRRVLEYFDAVKIGLTATPAVHTKEIFGTPIFTYSYREAVVDDFLIDHEPPLRIPTELSTGGIHFVRGDIVDLVQTSTGKLHTAEMPDNVDFEVDQFNRTVITDNFTKAIAQELVRHIDITLPDKTLIFAVNVAHADVIVRELRDAYRAAGDEIEDADIRRITGDTDQVSKLILSYRNDTQPKIAVTVDLLTTGIDVPKITNLVFMRRVNSRILFEQMIGRATRLCPEIEKKSFRIFDPVNVYEGLQAVTDMKPVAVDVSITLTKLFEELVGVADDAHRANVRDQIIMKLRRRIRKMPPEARARYEKETGETPEASLQRFRAGGPLSALADWAKARPGIGPILDWTNDDGTPRLIPISTHADKVIDVSRGYGEGNQRPEDYLDSFNRFVRENSNKIAALNIVVTRPHDLTREQLRQLRLELDAQGFTDTSIKRAWRDTKNEDIAANIIGFIRQAALGSPLIPFGTRVQKAVDHVIKSGKWTDPQVRWLRRIGEQIEKETIVDRAALDEQPFKGDGGFARIDKRFDGKLDGVLRSINEEIWRDAS